MRITLLIVLSSINLTAQQHTVSPGMKIQKVINRAKAGDTITVLPGNYHETLVIDAPNIRLVGKKKGGRWPRLDGKNKLNDGVIASGSGFFMENFRVENYKGNGVMTQGADYVTLRNLVVKKTGIYGIYPTRGKHILVEDTVSSGIADAAIYIGMCEKVDVRRNETFDNVAGIEIENSHDVIVENNFAHNNTGGILVFNLPGLPVKSGENIILRHNTVVNNNHPNFAKEGAIVAAVPQGTGIIILAADKVTVEKNIIRNNNTAGLIIADLSYISDVASPDPKLEPNPDDVHVLENLFAGNGKKPDTLIRALLILKHFKFSGTDVIATGTGKGHCLHPSVKGERLAGTEEFGTCKASETTQAIASMVGEKPTKLAVHGKKVNVGQRVYVTVCSGCHAMGMTRIGPPIEEIQKKYKGNPEGIVAFAKSPKKVRPRFPPMPAQTYLGDKKLAAVAGYMLSLKN